MALGITVSRTETVTQEVFCVAQQYVQRTKVVQKTVGQVYDAETASYIQEFLQFLDLSKEERSRKLQNVAQPALLLQDLVIPRGG